MVPLTTKQDSSTVGADEPLSETNNTTKENRTPSFQLVLRARLQRRDDGLSVAGLTPTDQVLAALEADVTDLEDPIIDWSSFGHKEVACIDIDVPADGVPLPPDAAVDRYFPGNLPQPLAAFRSHHGGLKAIFVAHGGYTAVQLAGAWTTLASLADMRGWRIELKRDCRHPASKRVDPDGTSVRCGPVRLAKPNSRISVPETDGFAVASEEDIKAWMDRDGLAHGRYSAEACPMPGCAQRERTSGSDPILIDKRGVKCFRCERFMSWDAVVGGAR